MILDPQGCNSTKKKDTSCNLNSQHCIQERNEYTVERVSGQNFLVKGVWTFKRHA